MRSHCQYNVCIDIGLATVNLYGSLQIQCEFPPKTINVKELSQTAKGVKVIKELLKKATPGNLLRTQSVLLRKVHDDGGRQLTFHME